MEAPVEPWWLLLHGQGLDNQCPSQVHAIHSVLIPVSEKQVVINQMTNKTSPALPVA